MAFRKYFAFLFQTALPAIICICVIYLASVPVPSWRWLEYLIATPLMGFMVMAAIVPIWRVALWLYSLSSK